MSRSIWIIGGVALATGCVLEQGSGVVVTEEIELEPFTDVRLRTAIDLELGAGEEVSGTFTCDDNLIDKVTFEVDDDGVLSVGTRLVDRGFRPSGDCVASLVTVDLARLENEASGEIRAGDLPSLRVVRTNASGGVTVAGMGDQDVLIATDGSGDVTVEDAGRANSLLAETQASGSVVVDLIDASLVNVDVESSGDVTLMGVTDELDLRVRAAGRVFAGGLTATRAQVRMSGSGDATIRVDNVVTGTLEGSGDLTVRGEARVDVTASGSGEVL